MYAATNGVSGWCHICVRNLLTFHTIVWIFVYMKQRVEVVLRQYIINDELGNENRKKTMSKNHVRLMFIIGVLMPGIAIFLAP
mgnify:CR=1 FL=1